MGFYNISRYCEAPTGTLFISVRHKWFEDFRPHLCGGAEAGVLYLYFPAALTLFGTDPGTDRQVASIGHCVNCVGYDIAHGP